MNKRTRCTIKIVGREAPDEIAIPMVLARLMVNMKLTDTGCWEWQGYTNSLGYGETTFKGKKRGVHRFMYEAMTGKPVPQGLEICHSCHNRACFNPDHIRQDTHAANLMDSSRDRRLQGQMKTHCLRGHPLSGDNLTGGQWRACKICSRARYRKRLGWPEHLAYSEALIPDGYKMDRVTGQVVPVRGGRHE